VELIGRTICPSQGGHPANCGEHVTRS